MHIRPLVIVVALAGAIGVVVLTTLLDVASAQDDGVETIFRCFHNGAMRASAPNVEDFRMRQLGFMIEVRWTDPDTGSSEILATNMPCLYRVTQTPESERPAD